MSETKQLLADKKAITPLWIVALFVSLTETVLGVAVTQTSGGIQVSLTVFVIMFPLLIAGSFFGILWSKPYVFYPPTEFGPQVNVMDYVKAMQGRGELLQEYAEVQVVKPPTEKEIKAVDQIVEMFLSRLAPTGLVYLYAFSLAHSNSKPVIWVELAATLLSPADSYGMGIISASAAVGLLTYTRITNVDSATSKVRNSGANVIEMNEKLKAGLRSALDQRLLALEEEGYFEGQLPRAEFERWQTAQIARLEEHFDMTTVK